MSNSVVKTTEDNVSIINEHRNTAGADVVRSTAAKSARDDYILYNDYNSAVAAENSFMQHGDYQQYESAEQNRRTDETLDSVRFDNDIDLDRERSREQLGYREYQYKTRGDIGHIDYQESIPTETYYGEPLKQKYVPAYQAERYRPVEIEETTVRRKARYGEVERATSNTAVIGGSAGAAATLGNVGSVIRLETTGATGAAVIKQPLSETIKTDIVRPSAAKDYEKKVYDKSAAGIQRQGVIKTVAGVAGREIVAAIGHGGDELSDKVRGQTVKYGYKTGKYAALGTTAVIGGTFRIAKYSSKLGQDVKTGLLTGKEARNAALTRTKTNIAESGTSIKKIIKTEVIQGIEDFHGSDDLGMKALTAPKDIYVKTKRTYQVIRATGGSVKAVARGTAKVANSTANGIKTVATGIKNALSNPVIVKATLIVIAIILFAAMIMSVVASVTAIIPSISLKSDDKELTRTYEYITKLDAELTEEIRAIETNEDNSGIDEFHYYENEIATTAADITVFTNADIMIMFFDTKYDDYAFDKLIYGLFGGTNIKDEVTAIHNTLYSYTTNEWEEEIDHEDSDPNDGEDDSWTETVQHMDIKVTTQSFEEYLADNIDTLLTEEEQERLEILKEIGAYTARIELGSPFVNDTDNPVSSRWGWRIHPITGVLSMHTGTDIPKVEGTPINNVMAGTVTYTGYDADGFGNYCIVTSSNGKKEVLYAHMQSIAVSQGQTINKKEIVGYVGNTGASTGAHLHIEYSIDNGFATNPAFFLDGISY